MDRILGQAEADEQRLDAQDRLPEAADDRNRTARIEGRGFLPKVACTAFSAALYAASTSVGAT